MLPILFYFLCDKLSTIFLKFKWIIKRIVHRCRENYFREVIAIASSFIIARHRKERMSLAKVDTKNSSVFSHLSVTWGLISDIDIESERLRLLGGARFSVTAVGRLISECQFRRKVSYSTLMELIIAFNLFTFWLDNYFFRFKTFFLVYFIMNLNFVLLSWFFDKICFFFCFIYFSV